jgi:hypothetical protein
MDSVIRGKIDMPKLERSLKRYAADFGDTTAQAVIRWSIQTCRELARETQAWGEKGVKAKQDGAIISDAYNVLLVVDSMVRVGKTYKVTNQGKTYYVSSDKVLSSADQVNWWIDLNRTRRRARTAKLPVEERRVCTAKIFKKAMIARKKASLMAKGGWIGAGNDIAKSQKGAGRMNIGVGFIKAAQKHSSFGEAVAPQSGWSPKSKLTNRVKHSGQRHVLAGGAFDKASGFGLKKTISWYSHALKAIDKKKS